MSITGNARRIGRGDPVWEEILVHDREFFPRPWKKSDWDDLNLDHHKLWVWSRGGGVDGFALFGTVDETAHLLKISLRPELRGTGASRQFWNELVSELRDLHHQSIYLEVEESNTRARGFYRHVGFRELRIVKGFYSDGENAVLMQLTL